MSAQVQQHTKDSTGPGSNLLLILIVRHTAAGKERRGEKRKENVNAGMSHKVICNLNPTSPNRTSIEPAQEHGQSTGNFQMSSAFSSDVTP